MMAGNRATRLAASVLVLVLGLGLGLSVAIGQSMGPTVSLRLAPTATRPSIPVLDLQAATFPEAQAFVAGLQNGDSIDVPFPLVGPDGGVDDLDLTVEVTFDAATRSIDFVGMGALGNLPGATVVLTAIWPDDLASDPDILLGVRTDAFALASLGLPGPIGAVEFPAAAFVLPAASGPGGLLPSSALSPAVLELFGAAFPQVPGGPDFDLDLSAGLQFAGAVPLDRLPGRILDVLAATPGDEVGFRGQLGLDLHLLRGELPVGLDGFELVAVLPELGPVAQLDWISTDPASPTTLFLDYASASWQVEIAATLLADVGGVPRAFEVGALLDLDQAGAALHLEGATAAAWDAPFGVSAVSLETVLLEIDIDDAGDVSGAVTARVGVLPLADLGELMLQAVRSSGLDLPSIDLPEIAGGSVDDFELRLSGGVAGLGLGASASIPLLGKPATLFFNIVRDFDQNTLLLTGVELPIFGLSDLGFDGPLSGFEYPSSSFVLPRYVGPQTGPIRISARQLSRRVASILRASYPDQPQCQCNPPPGEIGVPEFVLDLSPGVSFAGTLPLGIVADALPALQRLLGTAPGAEVLFEGALGLDLSIFSQGSPSLDLDRLELRLSATGLAPDLLPPWLERDPGQPTRFHVLYDAPNLSAQLESGLRAFLDGEFRPFLLASAIDLTAGSESLELVGEMSSSWQGPFGVSWLDLDRVGIRLTAGAGGSLGGGLSSSFTLGSGPLAKDLTIQIEVEVGPGGQLGGEVVASANSLGISDLQALLQKVGSPLPMPALPDIAITNAQIALGADNNGPSFTLMGSTSVPGLNAPADLLFSLLSGSAGGGPQVITGFQLRNFGLAQLVPALDGTLVGDFALPSLNLVLSGGGGGGPGSSISADDLSIPARAFFETLYGTPDFDLSPSAGINLMAALPDLGPALGQALDTLGANGGAVLQGSIPTPIPGFGAGGGLDVNLRAELPPMSPALPNGAQPPWFRFGQVAFFIEIGAGGFAAGLDGTLGVVIDETDLNFYVTGEFGGPPIAITLSGGLIAPEPWEQPFGIPWITINELGLNMSFQPVTQSLGLGFIGDGVIVTKDVAVRGDLAISLSTGVPTNFVFDGESESIFALSDLAEIQAQMRTAAFPEGPPVTPLDLSKLGDVQIRPPSAEQPIRIKFALRRSANVEPGFALAGALWASTSGGELQELAAVDAALGLDGVFLFGQVPQDLAIGRFELSDPTIDIDLVPIPPSASFFVAGDIATPWSTKRVKIDLGRDDAEDVLENLSEVLDNGKALAAGLANDVVGALRGSLQQLLASAEAARPVWLDPLLAAIDEVEAVVTGVTPRELLDYALTGVSVGSPDGIPAGGVAKICRAATPFFEDGLCWTIAPSMSDDIGFQLQCPLLTIESGGQCYVDPPGPPRLSQDRRPEACGLFGNIPCCKAFHPEAVRVLQGGQCWVTPPSVTTTVPKVSVCLGVISGESCLGTPPVPEGGTPLECPLATPLQDAGLCYTVPPNVFLDLGNVCTLLEIGCSVDELIAQDVIPAATKATNDKLDEHAPPLPPNLPPIPDAGPFYDVEEGGTVWLDAGPSLDPEGLPIGVVWDLDGDEIFETAGPTALFDAASVDGPALVEVAFEVTDGEMAARGAALVIVANVAPQPIVPAVLHAASNQPLAYGARFEDPGPDSWDATIDYGDGTTSEIPNADPNELLLFHLYPADGVYEMKVQVVDSDGGVGHAHSQVFIPEPSARTLGLVVVVLLAGLRRAGGLSPANRPAARRRPSGQ